MKKTYLVFLIAIVLLLGINSFMTSFSYFAELDIYKDDSLVKVTVYAVITLITGLGAAACGAYAFDIMTKAKGENDGFLKARKIATVGVIFVGLFLVFSLYSTIATFVEVKRYSSGLMVDQERKQMIISILSILLKALLVFAGCFFSYKDAKKIENKENA